MVSIVMPAYNVENYVIQAIESVLKQTYTEWEIIIVEDCSEDNTLHVLQTYIMTIDNALRMKIHLLKNKKNKGVAYCRNRGIAIARGEWIAFLDSDDMWCIDKLDKQIRFYEQKIVAHRCALSKCMKLPLEGDKALIFTGSVFMDESGNRLNGELHVPPTITYQELLKQNLISCSSVMINKNLIRSCMNKDGEFFPDTRRLNIQMHEDFPAWLKALEQCGYAFGIDEPLLIYRSHYSSQSGNKKKSVKMTWHVYRYMGLSVWESMYYFCWYVYRSIKKYRKIRGKK